MFVSRIKEIRTRRGVSQKQLGKRAGGLSQVQISYIERNISGTKFSTIEAIGSALNINPYELIAYKCPEYENCTNPEKKQSDCYVKGKCEIYNNSMYLLYFIVFCRYLYDISPFT